VDQDQRMLDYHVVDVFTDVAFAGNPLAVVLGSEGLTTSQLQALAREFHLSETAFPQAPSDDDREAGADYRLRIFTPEVELPFAGHPSVGTAWLLSRLGQLSPGTVHQACGEGVLPLDVATDGRRVTLTGGLPHVSDPIDPAGALSAVGLAVRDLLGPPSVVAGTGLGYAVVPVVAGALGAAKPDLEALRQVFRHPNEATGVYLVSWDTSGADPSPTSVRARMFAGDVGVTEDAATGSAALALGAAWPVLRPVEDGVARIDVVQGVEMGRPSLLQVAVDVADGRARRTTVTGSTVHVAQGRVAVPPA
jgi:trans-2,3-dihydro-3-hydroxyanthranilate isomerase